MVKNAIGFQWRDDKIRTTSPFNYKLRAKKPSLLIQSPPESLLTCYPPYSLPESLYQRI